MKEMEEFMTCIRTNIFEASKLIGGDDNMNQDAIITLHMLCVKIDQFIKTGNKDTFGPFDSFEHVIREYNEDITANK